MGKGMEMVKNDNTIDKNSILIAGDTVACIGNRVLDKALSDDDVRKYFLTEEGKKFFEWYMPRITEIIERYLGTGKKMKDATRTQVDAVSLVIGDLKELIANAK